MKTHLFRPLSCLGCCALMCATASAANIWISTSGSAGSGSSPPTAAAGIPTTTAASGTFYIWARPTNDKTIRNWSLKLISSNPSLVTFQSTSIESFNPVLGNNGDPIVRWEFVDEPTGANTTNSGMEGVNIFGVSRTGIGIGPASDGIGPDSYDDPFYYPGTNSWLLASVTYSLTQSTGTADISLQIGDIGISHAQDVTGSTATSVVFGVTTDPALNGKNQRNTSSLTPELHINVSNIPTPTADFDSDGDIDGRDFLKWQRGYGVNSSALRSQGDANSDGAVNAADLGVWQAQYGQSQGLAVVTAIPEPQTASIFVLLLLAAVQRRSRVSI